MGFQGRSAYPAQHTGYTRASSTNFEFGGAGSGQGAMAQGTAGLTTGIGPINVGSWEPSVLYLIGLVVGELIFFHLLGRVLK